MNLADIRVEHGAVRLSPVAGVAGAAVLTGWRGEFRVIPDGDIKNVPRPDAILVIRDLTFQRHIGARYVGSWA